MRIALALVACVLLALIVLGIGAGIGVIDISSHGIALVHRDSSDTSALNDQPRVISADDLLRQKKLTFVAPAEPAQPVTPAPPAVLPTVAATPVTNAPVPKPAENQPDSKQWAARGVVRVVAGSDKPLIDPLGNVWEAADGFDGGSITQHDVKIENTRFPDLYRGERWQVNGWHRQVPNGGYTVRLHFAENWDNISGPDQRVFRVDVQNQNIGNVDIFKESGGLRRALVRTAHADVRDGTLAIKFATDKQNPVVYGIEVIPDGVVLRDDLMEPRSDGIAIRIDAGSQTAVHDPRGNLWEADSGFVDGKIVDRGPIAIANTDFPDIYRTERYEMTAWNRQVPNGKYMVRLHFAETSDHINDSHQRIFHVSVMGNEVRDINVAKEAGGVCKALVKTFHVTVTDGKLWIIFRKGNSDDPPEINGIEVTQE